MGLNIVILGLSITSSWGNGHATTYRGLVRELSEMDHRIHFLERNVPWYAQNRDSEALPYCRVSMYDDLQELKERFRGEVRDADLVILGSFVPEGAAVGEWMLGVSKGLKAFYDIDTPVTIEKLNNGDCAYLRPDLIPAFRPVLVLHRRAGAGPFGTCVWSEVGFAPVLLSRSSPVLSGPERFRLGSWIPRDIQQRSPGFPEHPSSLPCRTLGTRTFCGGRPTVSSAAHLAAKCQEDRSYRSTGSSGLLQLSPVHP